MAEISKSELTRLLAADWRVVGYSTVILAGGAMVHSTLIQKGESLRSINVAVERGKEIGRTTVDMSD